MKRVLQVTALVMGVVLLFAVGGLSYVRASHLGARGLALTQRQSSALYIGLTENKFHRLHRPNPALTIALPDFLEDDEVWTADGTSVYALQVGSSDETHTLVRISLNGNTVTPVATFRNEYNYDIALNRQMAVLWNTTRNPYQIRSLYTMTFDDTELQLLVEMPSGLDIWVYDVPPQFSPDHEWVYFAVVNRDMADRHDIYRIRLDGSGLESVTRDLPNGATLARWPADADWFVVATPDGYYGLRADGSRYWLLMSTNGTRTAITHYLASRQTLLIEVDSNRYVAVNAQTGDEIWQVGSVSDLWVTPDENKIIVRLSDGRFGWMYADGTGFRAIGTLPISYRLWTGNDVVLVSNYDSPSDTISVERIWLNDGRRETLLTYQASLAPYVWAVPGAWLALVDTRHGLGTLYRIPMDTGQIEDLGLSIPTIECTYRLGPPINKKWDPRWLVGGGGILLIISLSTWCKARRYRQV